MLSVVDGADLASVFPSAAAVSRRDYRRVSEASPPFATTDSWDMIVGRGGHSAASSEAANLAGVGGPSFASMNSFDSSMSVGVGFESVLQGHAPAVFTVSNGNLAATPGHPDAAGCVTRAMWRMAGQHVAEDVHYPQFSPSLPSTCDVGVDVLSFEVRVAAIDMDGARCEPAEGYGYDVSGRLDLRAAEATFQVPLGVFESSGSTRGVKEGGALRLGASVARIASVADHRVIAQRLCIHAPATEVSQFAQGVAIDVDITFTPARHSSAPRDAAALWHLQACPAERSDGESTPSTPPSSTPPVTTNLRHVGMFDVLPAACGEDTVHRSRLRGLRAVVCCDVASPPDQASSLTISSSLTSSSSSTSRRGGPLCTHSAPEEPPTEPHPQDEEDDTFVLRISGLRLSSSTGMVSAGNTPAASVCCGWIDLVVAVERHPLFGGPAAITTTMLPSASAAADLTAAATCGFVAARTRHVETLTRLCRSSDCSMAVQDQAVAAPFRISQALRHGVICVAANASGCEGVGCGVTASGLTSSGAGAERCFSPDSLLHGIMLSWTSPILAKRYFKSHFAFLPSARLCAKRLSLPFGAVFPLRSIGGGENGAYFFASSARFHISSDIAYALSVFLRTAVRLRICPDAHDSNSGSPCAAAMSQLDREAVGDKEFLLCALEFLLETARVLLLIGVWCDGGTRFHIDCVSGPDEYAGLVDHDCYTHALARHHLRTTVALYAELQLSCPLGTAALMHSLQLIDPGAVIHEMSRAASCDHPAPSLARCAARAQALRHPSRVAVHGGQWPGGQPFFRWRGRR